MYGLPLKTLFAIYNFYVQVYAYHDNAIDRFRWDLFGALPEVPSEELVIIFLHLGLLSEHYIGGLLWIVACNEENQKCLLNNLWLYFRIWDFCQSNSIVYSFLRPFWHVVACNDDNQKCLLNNLWLYFRIWDFCQSNSIVYSFLRLFWHVVACNDDNKKCLLKNLWLYFCIWDFCQSNSIVSFFLRPFWHVAAGNDDNQKCLLKNLWLYFCIWDFCQSTISGDCCELWLAMKRTRSAFWTICDYISAFGTSVRAIQVSILFLDFFDMLSLAMKITRSAFWRTCDYISAFGTSVRALYLQTLLISPLILSIFAVRQR